MFIRLFANEKNPPNASAPCDDLPYFLGRDFLSALNSFFAWTAAFFAIFAVDLACLRLALAAFTWVRGSTVDVSTPPSGVFDGFCGCAFMGIDGFQPPRPQDAGMTGLSCEEFLTLGKVAHNF